jgi:CHAT domain-containing protein
MKCSLTILLFLGLLISIPVRAQSPFLLQSTAPELQELYSSGDISALVQVCRSEFLSREEGKHNEMYWKAYRHLLFAYFTAEKWDLAYLLADDLSKRNEVIGGKNNVTDAIITLIKGVVLNELGRVKEADPWYRNSYRSIQDNSFEPDAELFILLHYADYLRQIGEYTASGRVYEQILYSYDIENTNAVYQTDIYIGSTRLALDLGLTENAIKWHGMLMSDFEVNTMTAARRLNIDLLSAEMALNSGDYDQFNSLLDGIKTQLKLSHSQNAALLSYQLLEKKYYNILNADRPLSADDEVSENAILTEQHNPSIAVAIYIEEGKYSHHQGQYDQALKTYRTALIFIKKNYSPEHPYYQKVTALMGLTAWARGDISKAANYLNRAAELNLIQYIKYFAFLSDQEKEAFYKANLNFENVYGSFVMENHKEYPVLAEKLMNHLMVFKGLLFNTNLTMRRLVFSHEVLRMKFDQYLDIRSRIQVIHEVSRYTSISRTEVRYDSLLQASEALERELSLRTFLINQESISSTLVRSWSDLRAKIDTDKAFIEVMKVGVYDPVQLRLNNDEFAYLYLFLSYSSSRPQLFRLAGEPIERQSLAYKNAIKYKVQESKTYETIWRPVVRAFDLSRYRNIYIVPDGIYNLVNLSSLYNQQTEQYLIDNYTFELLGNAGDLIVRNNTIQQANQGILLMGYPLFGASKLLNTETPRAETNLSRKRDAAVSLLPGTLEEVHQIEGILTSAKVNVETLTHDASNEFDLKQKTDSWLSPQVIHLATHGFAGSNMGIPSDDPLEESGLLLTGAQWAKNPTVLNAMINSLNDKQVLDNGILSAREVMDLHLMTTDLVVLSACETGLGKMNAGEGVYGLHRAFQTAGAKSVIMTLWKVDDQATRDFMISFYQEWSTSGNIKNAFRNAQLSTKEKYQEPYYWAAFTLVGK